MRIDASGNVGINYTTPVAKLDVNGTVRYVSTTLTGVSAGPTLNYNWLQTSGVLQSYKIATLPISTGGTYDYILIEGVLGQWESYAKYAVKLSAGNRGGLNVRYLEGAAYGQAAHIDFYTESDTSVSVWVVLDATTYCTASLNITVAYGNPGGIITYPVPVNSTPTGTLTYSTKTATPNLSYGSNVSLGVGIGTTTPLSTLDVNGNASFRSAISTAGAATVASLTSNGAITGTTGTFSTSLYSATFNTAGTATVNTLTSNGTVTGTSLIPSGATVPTNGMFLPATNSVGFATASTERMRIDSAGNMGIGTTTAGSRLTVSAVGAGTTLVSTFTTNVTGSYIGFFDGTTSDRPMIGSVAVNFVIRTSGSERMRIDASGNVGIGTVTPGYKLQVNGSFAAITKSFVIDHPTRAGMKLRYGSLEGPENGVYVRGRLNNTNTIELPDYWTGLVDENSITVNLTAIGSRQNLWVEDIVDNTVVVGGANINCFYTVFATRKDVGKLVVEF